MDMISKLPDEVLCHILSFLTTKQAVATSILSTRWVYLWLSVPVIDLDDSIYLNPERKDPNSELFMNFFERVSSLNESETILKFRLRLHCHVDETIEPLSEINGFIQNVFLRNVVEIDFKISSYFSENEDGEYDDWINIPHSKSLEVLKVRTDITLNMPAFPGCFPRLRVFDARLSLDTDDELLTDLFPCLPALEKLCLGAHLSSCIGEFSFNIGGAALKHVELDFFITDFAECEAVVVIDAPKLEYLRVRDTFLALYLVKHEPAISEVRLHVQDDHNFSDFVDVVVPTHLSRFIELLQGLVNTKFISISASTLEVIFSQYWNIPVLPKLTKLELDVPASSWILLLHLLERCPNLKVLSLIIKEDYHEESEEEEWVVPDVVPSCLSSCIKEIEIKRLGNADEEEMIKYLLDNAKVLDKFTVDSRV